MGSGIDGYDERQKALRRKFGYQAFWIMAILGFLNAYICEIIYPWADPLVANFTVFFLSVFYFGFRTIFSGAYTGNKFSERRTAILIPLVCGYNVIVHLSLIIPHLVQGKVHLIEDGKATIFFITVFITIIFIPFTAAYYIRRSREKGDKE